MAGVISKATFSSNPPQSVGNLHFLVHFFLENTIISILLGPSGIFSSQMKSCETPSFEAALSRLHQPHFPPHFVWFSVFFFSFSFLQMGSTFAHRLSQILIKSSRRSGKCSQSCWLDEHEKARTPKKTSKGVKSFGRVCWELKAFGLPKPLHATVNRLYFGISSYLIDAYQVFFQTEMSFTASLAKRTHNTTFEKHLHKYLPFLTFLIS